MAQKIILPSVLKGFLAASLLLIFYFATVTLISGWDFAQSQFANFWYFILTLSSGFGIQVGLYTYLRQSITQKHVGGRVVVVSGTTSTTAMLACCAHYLVNIAPLLGVAGAISIVAQYQQQLFWIGMLFNLAGIAYLMWKLSQFKKQMVSRATVS